MLFNVDQTLLWLIGFILFVWLGGLTFLLFKALSNYNRLTKGVSEKTLSEVLKNFLDQERLTREELEKVETELKKINHYSQKFIQKIGLVRFNPFSDTGGDQSFAVSLLDGKDNGIVITSLYARTGVRWYIKTIKNGKGVEHELSQEEKEALRKVKKVT